MSFEVKLFSRIRRITVRSHVEIVKSKFLCRVQSEVLRLKFYLTPDFVTCPYTVTLSSMKPRQNPLVPGTAFKTR